MRSLVVALVATCAAGVLGAWLALRSSEAQAVPKPTVEILGGLAAQRALLRGIVNRVEPTRGLILRLRPPPRSFRPRWRGWRLDLNADPPTIRTIRSMWEQHLIATLFLAETQRRTLPWIGYVASDGGGGFFRAGIRDLAAEAPSGAALLDWAQRLRRAAAASRARVAELRVLRPGPVLFAVTLRVADPAHFLNDRSAPLVSLWRRHLAGLFGRYVALEDASGEIVWAQSSVPGTYAAYVRPDLAGCDPLYRYRTGPSGRHIPPCPV